jgi:hypothetical protein
MRNCSKQRDGRYSPQPTHIKYISLLKHSHKCFNICYISLNRFKHSLTTETEYNSPLYKIRTSSTKQRWYNIFTLWHLQWKQKWVLFVILFLSPKKVSITRTNDKATKAHLAETDLYSYRKSPWAHH